MVTVAGPVVQEWDARRLVRIGGPMPHTKDVRSVAYVSGESRLFTITEGDRGRFWDTPLAPAADASLLADVAEVVGGYGVNDLGALQPLPKAADHIGRLRWDLGSPAPGDSVGRIVARWLLSDPTRRTFAPLARAGADGRGVTWGETVRTRSSSPKRLHEIAARQEKDALLRVDLLAPSCVNRYAITSALHFGSATAPSSNAPSVAIARATRLSELIPLVEPSAVWRA